MIGMMAVGPSELVLMLFALLIGTVIGRAIAAGLGEEKRKIVGGVTLLVGVVLFIFGLSSINSASSQLMGMMGRPDKGGVAAIGFGVIAGIVGVVVLLARGAAKNTSPPAPTKKCPSCAELIQAEAKVCRYCGRELPAAA